MSSESRRVLVFGLLACLLGGYAYVTTPQKRGPDVSLTERKERPVLDFRPDEVVHIDLVYDGQQVLCRRTAQGWEQEPQGLPIRAEAVDEFLANLKNLVNLGEVEIGNASLAEYGLSPPASRVVLQLENGEARSLALGNRNPVQTSIYAQVNNSPQVVLVGAVVLWDMRKLVMATQRVG
ncbi:MAG: DUF4340 domain-containing protein [Candidatus Binatia bacterium]|nr:DUF4340 domain-containing protein [Candidatus Binatia bacterium]